jgi:hypothetical protein
VNPSDGIGVKPVNGNLRSAWSLLQLTDCNLASIGVEVYAEAPFIARSKRILSYLTNCRLDVLVTVC